MKQLIGFLYRHTPPGLIRSAPDIWPLRVLLTFLLNGKCRQYGIEVAFLPGAFQIRKGNHALRVKPVNWIYGPTLAKEFDNFFNWIKCAMIVEA